MCVRVHVYVCDGGGLLHPLTAFTCLLLITRHNPRLLCSGHGAIQEHNQHANFTRCAHACKWQESVKSKSSRRDREAGKG